MRVKCQQYEVKANIKSLLEKYIKPVKRRNEKASSQNGNIKYLQLKDYLPCKG